MNNCCELNLKKNLNIIYDDPLARNEMKKRRYDLHLPSFLAHGLMDTCRGHMYNTSHGFAGDYLLINNYAECYRDKSYGSPYDHYFIRENIQGERKCKFVIGLSKSKTPHDFDPWVDILKVLFGESNQFLYNDYFTYYTKDDVQLLHVMMEYENEDEIPKYEPFHFKNFTDIKGLGSVRGFGNHLKSYQN
ncbi:hypothetical protein SNEBB_001057 [Seison nebaliae]|nr:hypothetical protein SNEBB_001057 [Seison nebaliae]